MARDMQTFKRSNVETFNRPTWPLKTLLAVLFLGPLVAPLFQATRLPFAAGSGALARDLLSHYICPTPAKSYIVLGFPMAVCARCWGATIGLWGAWLLFRREETGDRRQETGDRRQETGDRRQETGDRGRGFRLWSLVSGLSSLVSRLWSLVSHYATWPSLGPSAWPWARCRFCSGRPRYTFGRRHRTGRCC